MKQFFFDFAIQEYPSFDKFLGHSNGELLYMLKKQKDQFVFVWGETGSGKSHLLKAWVAQALANGERAGYIDALTMQLDESALDFDYLAVDQADKLSPSEQAMLFEIFNRFRNSGRGYLLLSAEKPPRLLNLREDLRNRMGYCLIYDVKPLSDEEKIEALTGMAEARQLRFEDGIFPYLVNHWLRDMDSLVRMLDTICDYVAATNRPMTLSLLRKLLKQQENL